MKKFVLLFCIISLNLYSEKFEFKYNEGNKYRFLSTVDEQVHVNGKYVHNAEIHNKISIEIKKTKGKSGYLSGNFETSIEGDSGRRIFQRLENYHSEYWRDEKGIYDIEKKYYMPVLRNVPIFPEQDLKPGDTWAAEAQEVYDLRADFGIVEPLRYNVTVNYKYEGPEKLKGIKLAKIIINYTVFHKVKTMQSNRGVYPALISGTSNIEYFWNIEKGRPEFYNETFNYIWNLSDGNTIEYLGHSEAHVIEAREMDKDKEVKAIQDIIDKDNIENASVSKNETGITISLEKIQFMPESAVLQRSEKIKLSKIAEILKNYPDRDILVTGHTALAGTPEGRRKLSVQRAESAAEYLLSLGVSNPRQMLVEGFGADKPVASNNTEEGREKNRRVEITILEN